MGFQEVSRLRSSGVREKFFRTVFPPEPLTTVTSNWTDEVTTEQDEELEEVSVVANRDLLASWGLIGPTDDEIAAQAELLQVDQGDGSMLVWVRFPDHSDAPPITAHPPPPRSIDRPDSFMGWLTVLHDQTTTIHERRQSVGLPPQPFLYTLDQIADMTRVTQRTLAKFLHFSGVSPGKCPKDKMLTAPLGSPGEAPDWRVADAELIRWLRVKGFKVYDAWGLSSEQ